LSDPGLEATRLSNPVARSLPLLVALARNAAETVVLKFAEGASLRARIAPCR